MFITGATLRTDSIAISVPKYKSVLAQCHFITSLCPGMLDYFNLSGTDNKSDLYIYSKI